MYIYVCKLDPFKEGKFPILITQKHLINFICLFQFLFVISLNIDMYNYLNKNVFR